MNSIYNETNYRVMDGNFPLRMLEPSESLGIEQIDFVSMAQEGLKVFKDNPGLSTMLLSGFRNRLIEIDLMNNNELYFNSEVNVLINTQFVMDYIVGYPKLFAESLLVPFVTDVDKILWFVARLYYDSDMMGVLNNKASCLIYTWIYLLLVTERKECETGLTINLDRLTEENEIADIVLGDWDKLPNHLFTEIDNTKKSDLQTLFKTRKELSEKIRNLNDEAGEVATATNEDWIIFLQIVNDLARNEIDTINSIIDFHSPKEKLSAIRRYNSKLNDVKKNRYYLNDQEYDLQKVFGSVYERFTKAPNMCWVHSGGEAPFLMNRALGILAMEPKTYKNLLIVFHQFRLDPNKDSAGKFFALALRAIENNLGLAEGKQSDSIDDIVEQFYSGVKSFFENNKRTIEGLDFECIQESTVSIKGLQSSDYSEKLVKDGIRETFDQIENSENYEEMLEEAMTSHMSLDEVNSIVEKESMKQKEYNEKILARQIVQSLDIIYMFCDALRISLNNKHAMVKIKDRESAEKCRRDLLKIDSWIVQKVYSGLDVLEYREKYGVDSRNLTDSEHSEEKYRSTLFADVMKDYLNDLAKDFENDSINQIFSKRAQWKEHIMCLPDCDDKAQLANSIDELSNRLCASLVEKIQRSHDDYESEKNELLTTLGVKSSVLPEDSIDSLTTAEILFKRYATEEYAQKRFDYSSISALYYQAFETAYNKLIWEGYSIFLDKQKIGGQSLVEILSGIRKKSEYYEKKEYHKFLGADFDTMKKYIRFKSPKLGIKDTTFTPYCMYGPFVKMMKNVKADTEVIEFCKYIASLVGFGNSNDMFNDTSFMGKFKKFVADIDSATGNRNNASHGGKFIDINQCTEDKRTVLDNLEAIRSDSMGLIEQLIGIVTYYS